MKLLSQGPFSAPPQSWTEFTQQDWWSKAPQACRWVHLYAVGPTSGSDPGSILGFEPSPRGSGGPPYSKDSFYAAAVVLLVGP